MNDAIADLVEDTSGTGKTQLLKIAAATVASGFLGYFVTRKVVQAEQTARMQMLSNLPGTKVIDV